MNGERFILCLPDDNITGKYGKTTCPNHCKSLIEAGISQQFPFNLQNDKWVIDLI